MVGWTVVPFLFACAGVLTTKGRRELRPFATGLRVAFAERRAKGWRRGPWVLSLRERPSVVCVAFWKRVTAVLGGHAQVEPVYPSLRMHGLGIELPVRVIAKSHGLRLAHKVALTIHWRDVTSWLVTEGSDLVPAEHVITLGGGRQRIHVERGEIGRLEREILIFARHHLECGIEIRHTV